MSSKCTQNEFKKNSKCEQKEPQLSKGKDSIDKVSKVKVSQEKQTIRSFLDSHNLNTIDSRYENQLVTFFIQNNIDKSEYTDYCMYVYDYLKKNHDSVDAKLFYTVSLKEDVLTRFNNTVVKKEEKTNYWDIWPNICPVCGRHHYKNQPNGDCPLDMSQENSSETIETAKLAYDKMKAEMYKSLDLFRTKLIKGVIS